MNEVPVVTFTLFTVHCRIGSAPPFTAVALNAAVMPGHRVSPAAGVMVTSGVTAVVTDSVAIFVTAVSMVLYISQRYRYPLKVTGEDRTDRVGEVAPL